MERIIKTLNKRKTILTLILTFSIILSGFSISNSYENVVVGSVGELLDYGKVGDTINLTKSGVAQLGSSEYLYCVNHGNPSVYNNYKVAAKIAISGNTAQSLNADGTSRSGILTDEFYGQIAYILGAGDYSKGYGPGLNNYSDRQLALYKKWNSFAKPFSMTVDYINNNVSETDTSKKIISDAENYARNLGNSGEAGTLSSMIGNSITTNNAKLIGPIRIKFTGSTPQMRVYDTNNQLYQSVSTTENADIYNPIVTDLVSEKDFYIQNWGEGTIGRIEFETSSSQELYKADIFVLDGPSSDDQRLIAVKAYKESGEGKKIEINVTTQPQYDSLALKVVKHQYSNETIRQDKVGFIIQNQNGEYLTLRDNSAGYESLTNGVFDYNDFTFTTDKNSAIIFETVTTYDGDDKMGYFQINNLPKGTYKVGEVFNHKDGYELSTISKAVLQDVNGNNINGLKQTGNKETNLYKYSNDNGLQTVTINTAENDKNLNVLRVYDRIDKKITPGKLNIRIIKKATGASTKSDNEVSGAEFKIKTSNQGKWLKETNDGYDYVSFERATTFTTKSNGERVIEDLDKTYSYTIFETETGKSPNSNYSFYSLSEQPIRGMTATITNTEANNVKPKKGNEGAIDCGTVELSYKNRTSAEGVESKATITNVLNTGGSSTTTTRRTSSDIQIEGYVWLDRSDAKPPVRDNLYNKNSQDILYDNNDIKVTLYNSKGTKKGSTATVKNGKYSLDTDVSTTTDLDGYYLKIEYPSKYRLVTPDYNKTNGSKAVESEESGVAYIYDLSKYKKDNDYYSNKTISNMNMGLIEVQEPNFAIQEDIDYVKVSINNYTYTYKYGESGNNSYSAAPKARWQNKDAYSRSIYPSDIAYSNVPTNKGKLEVDVVYNIKIQNTAQKFVDNNPDKSVDYAEKYLEIEKLYNNFDTDRYELCTENTDNNVSKWELDKNKNRALCSDSKIQIQPGETINKKIQFRVKPSELNNLFVEKELGEKTPTEAEAYGHHEYWIRYWEGKNGQSVKKEVDKKTDTLVKKDDAHYLVLTLGTERIIKGTVFEDIKEASNTGEALGNGIMDNDEKGLKGVKIDLLLDEDAKDRYDTSLGKATRYELSSDKKSCTRTEAQITSNENGEYSFRGVVPGKYYVRFTYGDETTIKAVDYKSTIITDSNIKDNSEKWYLQLKSKKYSTALDNLDQRAEVNSSSSTRRKDIEATTPIMGVGVENTLEDYINVTKENDGTVETISGINFGIIKVPEIKLMSEQLVTYIKVTNTQGNVLMEGNPGKTEVKGMNNLDDTEHFIDGSTLLKSEIEPKELYGATMTVGYTYVLRNESEVNYSDKKYYRTGRTNQTKPVTIDFTELVDHEDSRFTLLGNSVKGATATEDSEITKKTDDINYDSKTITFKTNQTLEPTGGRTKNGKAKSGMKNVEGTVYYELTRKLSSQENDFTVSNIAEATNIEITSTPALIRKLEAEKGGHFQAFYIDENGNPYYGDGNPTNDAVVAIVPPTGADKATPILYVETGIVLLLVLSTGIVVIKKKVIDE